MIRINLLGEKKDNSALYTAQLLAFGGVIFLILAGCTILHTSASGELELVKQTQDMRNAELARLKAKTEKVESLDKKRKLLAEKLNTIATLKARKQGPVRVLDDLTNSIPRRAWLQNVIQKSENMEFSGIALDPQTVSQFMVALKNSQFYSEVDLGYSRQYMRDGVKLQQFSVTAKLGDPLMRKKSEVTPENADAQTAAGEQVAAADGSDGSVVAAVAPGAEGLPQAVAARGLDE